MVCCSCYSDRKPRKPISDFPHNAIRNNSLCSLVPEHLFSVCKSHFHNCFNINSKGTHQIIPCLLQCCGLYLRNDSSKFLFCDFFRYLPHFCLVLFCSAAVAVLCAAGVIESAIFADGISSTGIVVDYHCLTSLCVAGWGFGIF